VRILYAEDSLSRENIYTGDLRQEGFYLPILDLIQLSPRRPRGEEDDLTVILHEMAHHFLISAFPDTSSAYWLNEGLACCLEISFFDPDGSLRTPLFNQALHQHARRLLRRDGRKTFENRVSELIDASWFEFHNDDAENSNYAYSWSFYWHLLESFEGTLESRILQIVDMTPEELRSKIPGMIDRLRGRTDDQLAQLARDPALRGWTLERWAELPFADGRRFLEPLQAEIAPENSPSELSWSRATRLVNSRVRGLSRSQRRDLHRKIARELGSIDTPVSIRITIAEALGTDGSRSWSYIEPLIDGLENANGEFRASCARALARLSRQKPTIVNPSFWQTAPPEIRAQEIDEWRNWFSRRR